jgi:hydroxyethylthiazole kinase-like uncharacterized protein yjeF
MRNAPDLWAMLLKCPDEADHKYSRGQVAVLGGMEMTGAACLAAHAASRIGAGLTMIINPTSDFPLKSGVLNPVSVYRSFMPHLIVKEGMGFLDYLKRAELRGRCAAVLGPGLGLDHQDIICRLVQSVLRDGGPVVLDADALNAYEGQPSALLDELHANAVLTPHEGELKRLFPDLADRLDTDRKTVAEEIAGHIKGVLVLKGAKTIVAAKGHKTVVNSEASPYLATAGSGDVLSGMIAGLLAQGVPAFDAACAAVWIHGRAGQNFGLGLIATDLPDLIPDVLQEVLGFQIKVS